MSNFWKVNNISKGAVKVSIRSTNLITLGVVLQNSEFCICLPQLTTPLDAQERRKFIKIDRNYTNDLKLEPGKVYSESFLQNAIKMAEQYTATPIETVVTPAE